MSTKKRVLENSFLYTFSSLLIKAMGFLLLPLYTMFLSPEEYGTINLATSFLSVATFVVAFSLNSGIVRFYIEYKDNHEKLRRFIGTVIIFICISSVFFVSVSLIFNQILIDLFFENILFYPIVLITLLTLTFFTLYNIHQNILQAAQDGRKLTTINLIVFSLIVVLNILFIVIFKMGAAGMLLSQLIVYLAYSVYIFYDLQKNKLIKYCIDLKLLTEALRYSIPLMPHNLSTRIASLASRVIMNTSWGTILVGLYSVSFQIGGVVDTIQASVNKAFRPWFFEMMKSDDKDNKDEIIKLSSLLLSLYSLVYMVIGLFSQEAILLMTPKNYIMAWTVIPILVIAFSIKSIYYFYINLLLYYRSATKKIFLSTLAGSFADVLFAYLLIPIMGLYGAALAFLLAKIVVVIIVYIISKKYNVVGYRVISMIKIILPSLIFMSVGLYFSYTLFLTEFSLYNLMYKFTILVIYIYFLYFNNKKTIKKIIKTPKIQSLLIRFTKKT